MLIHTAMPVSALQMGVRRQLDPEVHMRRRRLAHFSLLSLFTLLPSLAVSQPLDQPVRIIIPVWTCGKFGRYSRE